MEIRIFYVGVCLYGNMLFHAEECMRNLKRVLYPFTVSLCLGVTMLEAGNDNLIPMRIALHPAFNHCLIQTDAFPKGKRPFIILKGSLKVTESFFSFNSKF